MDAILHFFSTNFKNLAWLAVFLVAMLPIAEAKVAIPFGLSVEIWGVGAMTPSGAAIASFLGSTLPAFFIIPFLRPLFTRMKKSKMFSGIAKYFEKKFKRKIVASSLGSAKVLQALKEDELLTSVKDNKENIDSHNKVAPTSSKQLITALTNNKDNYTIKNINTLNGVSISSVNEQKERKNLRNMLTLLFFVALPLPLAGVWTSSGLAAYSEMKFWPSIFSIAFGNLIEVIFITVISTIFIDSMMVFLIATIVLVALYVLFIMLINKKKSKQKFA